MPRLFHPLRHVLLALALLLPLAPLRAGEVVVAAWNVENYWTAADEPNAGEKPAEGKAAPPAQKPKSESSAAAVVRIVAEISPDILGLCEMGREVDFAEFRRRMSALGLDYPHHEWVAGPDPARHMALVSRFPIVGRHSRPDVPYDGEAGRRNMRRGILDVTVQVAPGFLLRIVGVHLKSKRPVPGMDADLERLQEAHALRLHLDKILRENPAQALLVFGDFNDTKTQPAVRAVAGERGDAGRLVILPLADDRGERWTHYWKQEDLYSRFDYLFVNRPLAARVLVTRSGIHRAEGWSEASDHRPVFVRLRTEETR